MGVAETLPLTTAEHPSLDGFWRFVEERHKIWLRRETGQPRPWSDDPILNQYHFCNVFRDLDYGTRWYGHHIAPLTRDLEEFIWYTLIYRLVNDVTWFLRLGHIPSPQDWKGKKSHKASVAAIEAAGKPHSQAYLTFGSPSKQSRTAKLVSLLDDNLPLLRDVCCDIGVSRDLEYVWGGLQGFYGIGPFVAMQIYRDLIFAGALDLDLDEDSWCYIGPGAQYALGQISGEKTYQGQWQFLYAASRSQHESFRRLDISNDGLSGLNLNDIQHCMCEYGKWLKFRQGKGKRRYYRPHDIKAEVAHVRPHNLAYS